MDAVEHAIKPIPVLLERIAELEASVATLREALDTFSRAWVISLAPFNYRLDDGAAKYIPGGWPTVGEFKAAHAALTNPGAVEALERVKREAKAEALEERADTIRRLHLDSPNIHPMAKSGIELALASIGSKASELRGGQ